MRSNAHLLFKQMLNYGLTKFQRLKSLNARYRWDHCRLCILNAPLKRLQRNFGNILGQAFLLDSLNTLWMKSLEIQHPQKTPFSWLLRDTKPRKFFVAGLLLFWQSKMFNRRMSISFRLEWLPFIKRNVSFIHTFQRTERACNLGTCLFSRKLNPFNRFPYVDTLKLQEKFGAGCLFYGHGSPTELAQLESLLDEGSRFSALFCEFPSNPLLKSVDLSRIHYLARKYGFAIVLDDTIGNFVNVSVLEYVDILVTSLTKIFSGDGNVMAGR